MARLPTVKVKKGDRYRLINEADFDPAVHELYGTDSAASIHGGNPDRQTLEARATELGIKFTRRMKDETLRDKIAAAEAEG